MTEEQIKAAIDGGAQVFWGSASYPVIKLCNQYYITCVLNSHSIALSHNGILNGCEEDFYIEQ